MQLRANSILPVWFWPWWRVSVILSLKTEKNYISAYTATDQHHILPNHNNGCWCSNPSTNTHGDVSGIAWHTPSERRKTMMSAKNSQQKKQILGKNDHKMGLLFLFFPVKKKFSFFNGLRLPYHQQATFSVPTFQPELPWSLSRNFEKKKKEWILKFMRNKETKSKTKYLEKKNGKGRPLANTINVRVRRKTPDQKKKKQLANMKKNTRSKAKKKKNEKR